MRFTPQSASRSSTNSLTFFDMLPRRAYGVPGRSLTRATAPGWRAGMWRDRLHHRGVTKRWLRTASGRLFGNGAAIGGDLDTQPLVGRANGAPRYREHLRPSVVAEVRGGKIAFGSVAIDDDDFRHVFVVFEIELEAGLNQRLREVQDAVEDRRIRLAQWKDLALVSDESREVRCIAL